MSINYSMDESAEKSCWGITLWAVAIVLGLALVVSLFSGVDATASISATGIAI